MLPKLVLILTPLLAACGKADDAPPAEVEHVHTAKYGGLLVELGDHYANVEIVCDEESGKLTLYSWDAHVEEAVRLSSPAIEVELEIGGATVALSLLPVADPLTGETAGDTSRFAAVSRKLEGAREWKGKIVSIETLGETFENVAFEP